MPKKIRKNLFEYLRHLDEKKDFPKIKKYLESPFFRVKSKERVIELFKLLVLHHPNYKDKPELSIGSLNKSMGITDVGNLKSTLVKCVEDYLIIKRARENEKWNTLLLAESLDKMQMHKELVKYADENLDLLKKSKSLTQNEYYLKYQLLIRKHKNLPEDRDRINDTSLEEAIRALSHYYLYSNLINLIADKMESIIFKRDTNVGLAENMINSVHHFQNILDSNITINYYIFKFHGLIDVEAKKEIYFAIKKLVSDQWESLNPFNRYEIYLNTISIINYIMSYGIEFEKEKFEMHKFWIEKNAHKFYVNMGSPLFMSIVVSASTVSEFEWCENFIKNNKDMLFENEKNQTTNYCEAYLFFKQKKYDDSLKLINRIKFLNPMFELNLRMLEVKCLLEKKSSIRFDICIKNIKNFISRHTKLSDSIKVANLNTIKYIDKVAKARSANNFNKLKLLIQDINNEVELNSKAWLLKKIDEITK